MIGDTNCLLSFHYVPYIQLEALEMNCIYWVGQKVHSCFSIRLPTYENLFVYQGKRLIEEKEIMPGR